MRFVLVAAAVVCASVAALLACNAVLGIDTAQPLLAEAGTRDVGVMQDVGDAGVPQDAGDAGVSQDAGDAGVSLDADLNCANYCALMAAECTGSAAEYFATNPEVCQSICPHFRSFNSPPYTIDDSLVIPLGMADDPSQSDAAADSLNCRLWHVNFAISQSAPILHCPHAGPLGGYKCGIDPCATFCEIEVAACKDVPQYDSGADCLNACRADAGYAGFPYLAGQEGGVATVMGGNTLDCRMYHVEAALKNDPNEGPAFHCPHTANPSHANLEGGTGPCQ